MVKIAVVGGSGSIAQEIIDVLVATKKHEILILSRGDAKEVPGVTWVKTDYSDKAELTKILSGVHTVLSFIVTHLDPGSATQKLVIDASIAAGVKRFAPSEWASSTFTDLPWYGEKLEIRNYLEEINKDKKVIEYTLFQIGFILDFLAPPGSNKHLKDLEVWIDLLNRRTIDLEGGKGQLSLITIKDLSNVVALAIDYEGEWPVRGGIQGSIVETTDVLEFAIKARGGKPFDVTLLKEEDVRNGEIKASWLPKMPAGLPPDQEEYFSKVVLIGSLLSNTASAWLVSDDWNRLFPDYKFDDPEEVLVKRWAGVP